MKRLDVAIKFLMNSRLKEYDTIIKKYQEHGYRGIGVQTAFELLKNENSNKRLLILRHDVDESSYGILAMSDIELSWGATSTYYFRWSTLDMKLVQELVNRGHEVSLHYETMPAYYLEKKLNPETNPVTRKITEKCRHRLKKEIDHFKKRLSERGINTEVKTIAGHGHPMNRVLGYVGRYLVLNAPENFFGDIIDAYDPFLLNSLDAYISDSNLRKCEGFRYGVHPLRILKLRKSNVLLLTHPHHWYYTIRQRFRQSFAATLGRIDDEIDKFDSGIQGIPEI